MCKWCLKWLISFRVRLSNLHIKRACGERFAPNVDNPIDSLGRLIWRRKQRFWCLIRVVRTRFLTGLLNNLLQLPLRIMSRLLIRILFLVGRVFPRTSGPDLGSLDGKLLTLSLLPPLVLPSYWLCWMPNRMSSNLSFWKTRFDGLGIPESEYLGHVVDWARYMSCSNNPNSLLLVLNYLMQRPRWLWNTLIQIALFTFPLCYTLWRIAWSLWPCRRSVVVILWPRHTILLLTISLLPQATPAEVDGSLSSTSNLQKLTSGDKSYLFISCFLYYIYVCNIA